MEPLFTPAVIAALSIVALINIGILAVVIMASKNEGRLDYPRSHFHWPDQSSKKMRVTPPGGII
jgi:hypothetical protein